MLSGYFYTFLWYLIFRCQSHLQSVDGPRWREKLPRIPSVLPWEVPDIRTPEEAASSSTTSSVPLSSQKSSPSSSVSSSQTQSSSSSTSSSSSSSASAAPTSTPDKATSDSSKKPAKEESFEEVKSRGNDCVKKVCSQSDYDITNEQCLFREADHNYAILSFNTHKNI